MTRRSPRYAEQIPVTLVDGKQHDFWRVSPAGQARYARPEPGARSLICAAFTKVG